MTLDATGNNEGDMMNNNIVDELLRAVIEGANPFTIGSLVSLVCDYTRSLEAIANRLPKDADGNPIAPGDLLYDENNPDDPIMVIGVTNYNAIEGCNDGEESVRCASHDCHRLCDSSIPLDGLHLSREAAEEPM